MRTPLITSTGINDRLKAMLTSGAPVDGSKAYGGIQPIGVAAVGKELIFDRLNLSSAQELIGQGAETRIVYKGRPGDPALFNIFSYTGPDNGYVHRPHISKLQIDCPNGGDAIGLHSSVRTLDSLTVSEVVIRGGGINLPDNPNGGGHYNIVLDDCEINPTKQAIRLDGQCNTIRNVGVRGNVVDASLKGIIELHGTCQFEGFPWPEGTFASPAIYMGDWRGMRGSYSGEMVWFESHREGTYVVLDNSDAHFNSIGGSTAAWPWKLTRGARLFVQQEPNAGAVVSDGTARLFVRGVDKTELMVVVK